MSHTLLFANRSYIFYSELPSKPKLKCDTLAQPFLPGGLGEFIDDESTFCYKKILQYKIKDLGKCNVTYKSWLIWKDPNAGKDWGWEEKGTTADEMVGWHRQLNGHEFG